jgi:site-specific DNA-methyltransferase (adenine-specific)
MPAKPYFEDETTTLYNCDFREVAHLLPVADCFVADPPYAQTSLAWDRWQDNWPTYAAMRTSSMWVFGTLRMFLLRSRDFDDAGFLMSQDIVWEKHNGSNSFADRFRRVHEQMVHFYRGPWEDIYKAVPVAPDAVARKVTRSKNKTAHWGAIDKSAYVSEDGGPLLMRSVIFERSCHGFAENETQKPVGIVRPLIEYSCPLDGLVVDPFCGSGTTLVAAKELGRRSIGIDTRESQCEIAARRLSQGVLALS